MILFGMSRKGTIIKKNCAAFPPTKAEDKATYLCWIQWYTTRLVTNDDRKEWMYLSRLTANLTEASKHFRVHAAT